MPYEEFYYIGEYISTLSISQTGSESGEEYTFCEIPMEEYNALDEQDTQFATQQQDYSDDRIIQETLSAFKSKVGGYYSGAGKLYHAVDYSNEYVKYDWSTKTYTCTFTGEYCTNIFDFYGTSTQTYFVRAEYVDTGTELVMLSFSIS